MAAPASADRRVNRTRTVLRDALVELMVEHGWEGVSVQQLCERANIGRSTFYLHFNGKEELLSSSLDGLRGFLLAHRDPRADRLGFVHGLVAHAYENRRLFRALVGRRSGQVVHERFRRMVHDLMRGEIADLGVPAARLDPVVHFVTGAFMELITWAIDRAKPVDPEEVEDLFHQMSGAAIARAKLLR